MFIRDNLSWINVEIACECLELSRSCYYSWFCGETCRLARADKNKLLLTKIKSIHQFTKKRYGLSKIMKKLREENIIANKKVVSKLMRDNGIRSIVHKKYKATTNSNHNLEVFDNVLNRQFVVPRINYAWVSDITYINTDEGWVYLATVIDLYSNKIISHSVSNRMDKSLVINTLNKALHVRGYPKGVIVHTDRGSQYASNAYKDVLIKHGLIGSMSRKGNCWDNAVAECTFGIIKKEYVYHVRFKTRAEAKLGIFDYIEGWYNSQRIHSKIGYLTPNEFEDLNKNLPIGETKMSKKVEIMPNNLNL